MSGFRYRFTVAVGTLAILAGIVDAVLRLNWLSGAFTGLAGLIAVVGIVGTLWKVAGTVDDSSVTPPPWSTSGALFETAPERSRTDHPLSGTALAERMEKAGETARNKSGVDEGLAVVRPALREALIDALGQSGVDRATVEAALADGSWTDDRMAAAVLDDDVMPPDQSLRRRAKAWLYPERTVMRRTSRAMQAVAEVSDDALPTVIGQRAPRDVPVLPPLLEDLKHAADGTLTPAVNPQAVARGPEPLAPATGEDSETSTADIQDGEEETEDETGVESVVNERTLRWRGGVAATILLAVVGLAARSGVLLLSATIPLAYVAYGLTSSVDVPDNLVAERTVEPAAAVPGQVVRVTVTVTNQRDRTFPDFRMVDSVPETLAVMDGTPRIGMPLGARETCSVEYFVIARRGLHKFEPPRIRLRNPSAGAVVTATPNVRGDAELDCRLDADAPPISGTGNSFIGRLTANRPGEGVEFHSTREYRTGDSADRIDWRQYAKRNELATVNYERQVSATVVLVLDARSVNRIVAGPGRPTAVELAAYAATRTLTDLLRGGRDVAVAVIGLDGPNAAGVHWLPPRNTAEQRARALELFRTAADATTEASDVDEQIKKVAALAPSGAHLVLVSPLVDETPVTAVETWRAANYQQVVLSPDVVAANTASGQFEQVRRRTRLARCQANGARTIDWRRGTPLAFVIEYAFAADARLPNSTTSGRVGGMQ